MTDKVVFAIPWASCLNGDAWMSFWYFTLNNSTDNFNISLGTLAIVDTFHRYDWSDSAMQRMHE